MKNMIKMVVTLSLISALAAAALAFGDRVTRDKIKMQAKLKAARAVKKIFPNCLKPVEQKIKNPHGGEITLFRCNNSNTAFIYTTKSGDNISRPYGGLIKMMIGVDKTGSIKGLEVISQNETPGLGANMAEKTWLKQFFGLSLTKGKLAVKKVDPSGSIDALSGATITSKAVTSTIKSALLFYSTYGMKKSIQRVKNRHNRRTKWYNRDPKTHKPLRRRLGRRRRINRIIRKSRKKYNPVGKTGKAGPGLIKRKHLIRPLPGSVPIQKDLKNRKRRSRKNGAHPDKKTPATMGGSK